jgi:Replicative DNA helicase
VSHHAYDITAEQGLLGAMILNNDAMGPFLSVPPDAYYAPKHQYLAGLMRDLLAREGALDPITLLGAVEEAGLLRRVGGAPYLHTLIAMPWTVSLAGQYAERLLELYGRRRLADEFTREIQMLDSDWELGELGRPISASVARIRSVMDELVAFSAAGGVEPPQSLDDFLAERDMFDWLIPSLMERGDRCIVTGEEGFGKSEFTSQIGVCVAGGVHPFLAELLEPAERRVLIIDCENGRAKHRRRLRRIVGAVEGVRAIYNADPIPWSKRLWVECRSAGLDLLKPADEAWLENTIASVGPDMLLLGPLYKLHTTNINDGEAARKMLDTIDRLRERHGFALLTEAHPGHGRDGTGDRMMRPEGSSLFMRWPEFGFGLRRNKDDQLRADVVAWRGDREEGRDWPKGLIRGHSGLLPWRPNEDYQDRPDEDWRG